MLLYLILAIVGTALLAYAIVNYIPKKLHWILSIVFIALIAYLVSLIYGSIMQPIHFAKEKKVRYEKVIDHLKMIREAEVAHRKITGKYTANAAKLVQFVETAKFPITQVRTDVKKVNTGGGIEVDREYRVVDTIGYREVKADFAGREYKKMFNVPGTEAKFEIKVDSIEKVQGIMSSVFQAKIAKDIVLHGMNKNMINEEKKALGGIEVKGEYISVGSLTDIKVNGNWPPFYDNKDKKDTK